MNKRFKWTGVSLASVLLAYGLYAVAAVPFIEPPPSESNTTGEPAGPAKTQSYAHLFPPGSWELDRPKILDTEQGVLLFDDYKPLKNRKKMRLNRCSLVRYVETKDASQDGTAGEKKSKGRPIVLRAVSGADLTFDSPLNIPRGEFGNLVSGRLNGEVIIYSPATDPKSDDAFSMTTKNVQINTQRIWTPHAVSFKYGLNSGSGRDLTIEWSQSKSELGLTEIERNDEPLGQLRSLELVHLDKFVLNLPADDLLDVGKADTERPAAGNVDASEAAPETDSQATPVEVTSDGPCRIDFLNQVASLSDHVRVNRHIADGQSDYLLCDLLEIHFGKGDPDPDAQAEEKKSDQQLPSLQLQRIVAVGYPVVIRVPSKAAEARAGRLEYDFRERRIWLEEKEKVELRDGRYRVEAKELEYAMGDDGRLGRLWARGPGHIWGEREGRRFEATWGERIRLRSHGENLVLSLEGDAEATLADTGRFAAEEVHVFFWEVPRPEEPGKYDLVPDRMKAIGEVVVDSAKLAAHVREANLWFRTPARSKVNDKGAAPPPTKSASDKQKPSTPDFERVNLVADVLHAQFIRGETMQIERLNIQGGIHFQQLQAPDSPPLVVRGDLFELENAHTENSRGSLVGRPASVSARGMQMVGPKFQLLRGENSLEVEGPGNATLPQPKTTGLQLPPPQVSWEGGMHFDGRYARFRQRVTTRGSQQLENKDVIDVVGSAETLTVALSHYVDFNLPDIDKDLAVREFRFDKDVKFESQLYDPQGKRKLFQQMEVPNLTVNQRTKELVVDGPGWVRGVQPRNQLSLNPSSGGWSTAAESGDGRPTPDESQLDFIRVDFANQMKGLLGQRQLEFGDHVQAIYGPVERWDQTIDPYQPQMWDEETFTLNCRLLSVADMGVTSGSLKNVVLDAVGNAFVKGQTFSAQGQRISYTRIKDQLVLVGDGRNDARLAYQPQPGSAPTELKSGKILFWPNTRQFELNDARSLDLHDLSQLKP